MKAEHGHVEVMSPKTEIYMDALFSRGSISESQELTPHCGGLLFKIGQTQSKRNSAAG